MVAIGRFPQAIREAAAKNEPMLIAQALLKIGQAGNSFYRNCSVLKAETPELGNARLAVMDSLRHVLAIGLGLLGVPTPKEM
jgi:arginyl-tRNA synthetase